MTIKNNLSEIVSRKESDFFSFKPTNAWFKEIRIGKKRFGKILRNEEQPTLDEIARLSNFFDVDIEEFYTKVDVLTE